MNREIKFNAWNKETKTMHYDILHPDNWSFGFLNREVFTWLQFTGLKDNKGKEVFEGDIVKVDWNDTRYSPTIEEVEWDSDECCFTFGAGTPSEVHWSHKVIGSIYENPEILAK